MMSRIDKIRHDREIAMKCCYKQPHHRWYNGEKKHKGWHPKGLVYSSLIANTQWTILKGIRSWRSYPSLDRYSSSIMRTARMALQRTTSWLSLCFGLCAVTTGMYAEWDTKAAEYIKPYRPYLCCYVWEGLLSGKTFCSYWWMLKKQHVWQYETRVQSWIHWHVNTLISFWLPLHSKLFLILEWM